MLGGFYYKIYLCKKTYYRNSNFKKDTYYLNFYEILNKTRATGNKDVYINTARKLNNCPFTLKLKGDIKIQEIFDDNWKDFLEKYNKNNLRTAISVNVEKMLKCKKFELGMSYYECENWCFH